MLKSWVILEVVGTALLILYRGWSLRYIIPFQN